MKKNETTKVMDNIEEENITVAATPKKRGRKPKLSTETAEVTSVTATVEEAPKKRGRKPKAETNEQMSMSGVTSDPAESEEEKPKSKKSSSGGWSNERIKDVRDLSIFKETMKVEIQLLSGSLGMAPSNPELLKYTAREDDELDIYGDGNNERAVTIWPKARFIETGTEGVWQLVNEPDCPVVDEEEANILPFIFNYQIRGMFKDSAGLLSRAKNNLSADLKAYKKWIDGNIMVSPRKIAWNMPDLYIDENTGIQRPTYDENGHLNTMARPLRTSGPTGERSAIGISEVVPPYSSIRFEILMTNKALKPVITEWLDYGLVHGLGQWRNSGIGIFRWRELDENWEPIEE
jgi:hypothetical protein